MNNRSPATYTHSASAGLLFLDTEFVESSTGPQLLSIALVCGDGAELYLERPQDEIAALPRKCLNKFVRTHVLTQLGRLPAAAVAYDQMPHRLSGWLSTLKRERIEVAYDYNVDFLLLERLLSQLTGTPVVELVPVHVGYVLGERAGEVAALASWQQTEKTLGLARHHALADALALAARFSAVHTPNASGAAPELRPAG